MSILAAGMLVRANKHAEILYESTHKVQLKLSDHVMVSEWEEERKNIPHMNLYWVFNIKINILNEWGSWGYLSLHVIACEYICWIKLIFTAETFFCLVDK